MSEHKKRFLIYINIINQNELYKYKLIVFYILKKQPTLSTLNIFVYFRHHQKIY